MQGDGVSLTFLKAGGLLPHQSAEVFSRIHTSNLEYTHRQ